MALGSLLFYLRVLQQTARWRVFFVCNMITKRHGLQNADYCRMWVRENGPLVRQSHARRSRGKAAYNLVRVLIILRSLFTCSLLIMTGGIWQLWTCYPQTTAYYACTCKRVSQVRAVLWLLRTLNQWTMELRFRWCAFSVVYTCAFTVNCLLRFALSDICRTETLLSHGRRAAISHTRHVVPGTWLKRDWWWIDHACITQVPRKYIVPHAQEISRWRYDSIILKCRDKNYR